MKREHWIRSMAMMTGIAMPLSAAAQHAGHQMGSAQAASPAVVADCARAQPQVTQVIDAANLRLETARQNNSPAAMRAAMDDLQGALGQVRAQLTPCAGLQPAMGGADPQAGHAMPGLTQTPPAAAPAAPMDHSKMPIGDAAPAGKPRTATGAKPAAPAAPMDHSKMPMGGKAPSDKPGAATGAKPAAPATPMDHSKMPMGGATAKDANPAKAMDPVTGLMVDPASAPKTTYQGQTYYFSSEQARAEFLESPAKFAAKPKPKS